MDTHSCPQAGLSAILEAPSLLLRMRCSISAPPGGSGAPATLNPQHVAQCLAHNRSLYVFVELTKPSSRHEILKFLSF